jgi:tetratricopeptide (TPR) repeat protein
MTTQLETGNREAFQLVSEALDLIERYQSSRDIAKLHDASDRLAKAREKDPEYFRARYYDAIIDDLTGQFKRAASKFTNLLNEGPFLRDEVRYNLGLAEYHRYSHSNLENAIVQFAQVLESATDWTLRIRARAALAQAYAMHMIPQDPDKPDINQLSYYWRLTQDTLKEVWQEVRGSIVSRVGTFRRRTLESHVATEVQWTAHNAKGMALMYYADYLPQIESISQSVGHNRRVDILNEAMSELDKAEQIRARDWANRCDIASAHMRLAYFKPDKEQFDTALKVLTDVIERLRPGYAFALYETGRIYRLRGEHDKAIQSFDEVMRIPEELRDVSVLRLEKERSRAVSGVTSFP